MRNHTKRVVRIVSGYGLLAAGIVMLVVPGPGVVTIVIGLGLLAEEFSWARSALGWLKRNVKTAAGAVRRRGRT